MGAAHLVAACYLLALALWALWALGNAGWDALGFATGRLTTVEVPLSSLQSQDVALTDEGLWVTTGADPQFHLELGQPVRSVLFATDAPTSGFEGYWAGAFTVRAAFSPSASTTPAPAAGSMRRVSAVSGSISSTPLPVSPAQTRRRRLKSWPAPAQ